MDDLVIADKLTRVVGIEPEARAIVDGVSFTVERGTLFAINGPSGSGKTTVLNLLTGIDRPTSGTVLFDGSPLMARTEDALARWRGRHVGIVFQFFHLIPTLTASENVLLGLELGKGFPRKARDARASSCLAAVGMQSRSRSLPGELSGGEQQRVAVARALANDPPLIVADEPTGNLDSKNAAAIFALLESVVNMGKTVIFVTHDNELASRARASIDLLDGQVVAQRGRPDAVVTGART